MQLGKSAAVKLAVRSQRQSIVIMSLAEHGNTGKVIRTAVGTNMVDEIARFIAATKILFLRRLLISIVDCGWWLRGFGLRPISF